MNRVEIYHSKGKETLVEVQFDNDTVWLTQAQIVELFQSSKANISEHIKSIFLVKELSRKETVRKFRTVRSEGKKQVSRELEHFNLDVILSVGYRGNYNQTYH